MFAITLIAMTKQGFGRSYSFSEQAIIGRQSDCDIQIIDSQASKQHARLFLDDKQWMVEDLHSLNGVFVNAVRITSPRLLAANDLISIGSQAYIFNPNFKLLRNSDREDHEDLQDRNKSLLLVDDAALSSLQNAQPFQAEQPPDDAANFLQQALKLLAEQKNDALEALLRLLQTKIDFDGAALLQGGQDDQLKALCIVSEGSSLSFSKHIAQRVLQEGKALNIPDALGDSQFRDGKSVVDNQLRSVLALALTLHQEVVGLLFLSKQQAGFYHQAQQNMLAQVAPVFALAIRLKQDLASANKRVVAAQNSASATSSPVGELLGDSPQMQALRELVDRVAPLPQSVLIRGETGSGKELVARRLHQFNDAKKQRHNKPFVVVNCAALPENLVESELFGHERGAFSGADKRRPGKLELANGGSLFLDEIGELSLPVQAKLLRALEQKSFYRLGGLQPISVDFRLITASHRDLKKMSEARTFRQDLYYRINVIALDIAPLRQRGHDIDLLAAHFLHNFFQETALAKKDFDDDVFHLFRQYPWPGNVRELRNVVERMAVLSQGPSIGIDLVPADLLWPARAASMTTEAARNETNLNRQKAQNPVERQHEQQHGQRQVEQAQQASQLSLSLPDRVRQLERQSIIAAMRQNRGRKIAAAKSLGISRPTLDKKLALYAIDIFVSSDEPWPKSR